MNFDRLYEILRATTVQLRKGEEVERRQSGPIEVVEVYAMPHETEAPNLEKVDVEFMIVGVDRDKAEAHKAELISILNQWPKDAAAPLADGPSYIALGADIGDQGAAFQLMALGKVLKLWTLITPRSFGFDGEEARRLAGGGMVLMSGYQGATAHG